MRNFSLSVGLIACLFFLACGSSEKPQSQSTQTEQTTGAKTSPADGPPVATTHGAPSMPSGAPPGAGKPGPDTAALDAKVEQADAKAKAAGATNADKQAAAAAYVERGNLFYNAGNPSLYKFALRDFRLALKHDDTNDQARAKRDQIVEIYQSMGRPVPELGN